MNNIVIGSSEWLEVRRSKISATDIAPILGISKWDTPLSLYERKLSGKEPERNYAMSHGLALEEDARKCFEGLTGEFVSPRFIFVKDDWKCASLDGINDAGVAVEIKCPMGMADHETALKGECPVHYYPQLQWQMLVAGLPWMYYFSYMPNDVEPCALVKVERSDMAIEMMVVKAKEFWDKLQSKTPPEATDRDRIELPGIMRGQEARAALLMEVISEAEKELEKIRDELIAACDGKKCEGEYLRITPYEVKGAVEYGKIEALKGVDLERYRKPKSIRWRIEAI